MSSRDPIRELATHRVVNQPSPLEPIDLYGWDVPLREALAREGGSWAEAELKGWSACIGSERAIALAVQANRHPPELRAFDRFGQRIDEVEYHPAYHELMALAAEHCVASIAWTARRPGAHVVHAALEYLLIQIEAGVCCPLTMTYASVPALRRQPELAEEWEPRVLAARYDPRCIPAAEKHAATIGMAMTEKQGGSDVRAGTTRARALGRGGPAQEYALTGHKWFCSAPMSDAFLTLAYTERDPERLSCFLVPRWTAEGRRNAFAIQRLKDKLGNRSNASSEIEYADTWARMVGEEGRGVATILEMVHHTRLDTALAAAGLMRQALLQALHHAAQRSAFGRPLIEQPLMRCVLADLALECEAATALALRVARSFDESAAGDAGARAFGRIATAVAKYWLNRRAVGHIGEALECLGGAGYVEESVLPRLYREAPLNGIWEGSGNVICLDVLRALGREPQAREALLAELELARGGDRRFDAAADRLRAEIEPAGAGDGVAEERARAIVERMALLLQASLLVRFAPPAVSELFCRARLGGEAGLAYGTLPAGAPHAALLERALPELG